MNKFFTSIITTITAFNLNAQSLYLPPTAGNTWDTISPESLGYCQSKIDSLYAFLDTTNTKAFILLKDGKIVLEKYFGTHTQSSVWQWASAGKTITSFMVGIAQQEGHLSINDTTSTYLGQGWTDCTPAQEERITIRHQLTMTSGLDDGVTDPFCTLDNCLIYKADAGTRWAYHNGPYTLLDGVVENAAGQTLNSFTTQKLKSPTGMTGAFAPVGYNNVFFSNARSMARFGLLMQNDCIWNNDTLLADTAYIHQMTNTSQNINLSYGYLWWLNGKPSYMFPTSQLVVPGSYAPAAPSDMFAGIGKNGQILSVSKSKGLVVVRMGNFPSGGEVPTQLCNSIWEKLNAVMCNVTSTANQVNASKQMNLFPNPANNNLQISLPADAPFEVQIMSASGAMMQRLSNIRSIDIASLSKGLYVVIVQQAGNTYKQKFIKN